MNWLLLISKSVQYKNDRKTRWTVIEQLNYNKVSIQFRCDFSIHTTWSFIPLTTYNDRIQKCRFFLYILSSSVTTSASRTKVIRIRWGLEGRKTQSDMGRWLSDQKVNRVQLWHHPCKNDKASVFQPVFFLFAYEIIKFLKIKSMTMLGLTAAVVFGD